jgi:hypothetical protein
MLGLLHVLWWFICDLFKSRRRLHAENVVLHHQLNIALRRAPPRRRLCAADRLLLVWMTRVCPELLNLCQFVKPETVLRWHRAGFKAFWRWKSRRRVGRPRVDRGLRDLIRRMSRENPLWGAPRIHGEILMLGFEAAQSTVSKYMMRPSRPPSQTWKTFLRNHAEAVAAIDMCVVPTLTFDLVFAFLVLGHDRRQLLWFEVTRNPTAELAGSTDYRGVSLVVGTSISVARQRPCLRTCLYISGEGDGYPRPTHLPWVTMAKWLRGTSNRDLAPRVPGPSSHLG